MAWTKTQERHGPAAVSTDGKATIYQFGRHAYLRVLSAPKGQRLDRFDSLTDAQAAYDTGDRSKGAKAKRAG